jgi:hypothetical protein
MTLELTPPAARANSGFSSSSISFSRPQGKLTLLQIGPWKKIVSFSHGRNL